MLELDYIRFDVKATMPTHSFECKTHPGEGCRLVFVDSRLCFIEYGD